MKNLYQNWTIGGPGYAVLQDKQIVENRRFNNDSVIEEPSICEWVDLGLPSGMLWADRNLGATAPEDSGLFYAWGDTQGYSIEDVQNGVKSFSWEDYKWCEGNQNSLTKYNADPSLGNVDNQVMLSLTDDAAYMLDKSCRIPTMQDIYELNDNSYTTSMFETLNNTRGVRFISKINGNSIFIPMPGGFFEGEQATNFAFIVSNQIVSAQESYNNHILQFLWNDGYYYSNLSRCIGNGIRPVKSTRKLFNVTYKNNIIECDYSKQVNWKTYCQQHSDFKIVDNKVMYKDGYVCVYVGYEFFNVNIDDIILQGMTYNVVQK